jgi:D-aminoacyl-tRNA deacylase
VARCEDGPVRAVVQRVDGARVVVDGTVVGAIEGPGLCVLVGATHGDTPALAARLADKVYDLRIFDEAALGEAITGRCAPPGRPRELSASDVGLPVLVVSQFTLYGQTRKGRRPTWDQAAPGPVAEPLVAAFAARLRQRGATVAEGRFGASMRVELVNDGPVTVIVELD